MGIMEDIIIINGVEFKQFKINKTYYVSKTGDVYSNFSKKIIKPLLRKHGGNKKYFYVDVYIDGKQRHITIHRLVYTTWVRELLKGEQVNHKDDNSLNNNLENLYVGTQSENIKDSIRNGNWNQTSFYLTVYDKKIDKTITFFPSKKFIEYCGHKNNNGNISKFFVRNWFKKRYELIEFKRYKNNDNLLKGVETNPDECKDVG